MLHHVTPCLTTDGWCLDPPNREMQGPQSFKTFQTSNTSKVLGEVDKLSTWPPYTQTPRTQTPDARSMARLKDRGAANHIRRMPILRQDLASRPTLIQLHPRYNDILGVLWAPLVDMSIALVPLILWPVACKCIPACHFLVIIHEAVQQAPCHVGLVHVRVWNGSGGIDAMWQKLGGALVASTRHYAIELFTWKCFTAHCAIHFLGKLEATSITLNTIGMQQEVHQHIWKWDDASTRLLPDLTIWIAHIPIPRVQDSPSLARIPSTLQLSLLRPT